MQRRSLRQKFRKELYLISFTNTFIPERQTSLIVPMPNGLLLAEAFRATGGVCAAESPTEPVVLIGGLSSHE